MMNPLKRPKASETQEELLRQQEEFFAQGGKPSAIIVQKGQTKDSAAAKAERTLTFASVKKDVVKLEGLSSLAAGEPPSSTKKNSQFKSSKPIKGQRVTFNVEDDEDPEEVMDRHDTHITTVLTKIMEHETRNSPVSFPAGSKQGFPTVPHRSEESASPAPSTTKKKKKKSLFLQQFPKSSPSEFGLLNVRGVPSKGQSKETDYYKVRDDMDTSQCQDDMDPSQCQDSSSLISGRGLDDDNAEDAVRAIHEENKAKIAVMSEEEILREQTKLKELLDPSLVAFLQKKQKKTVPVGDEMKAPANVNAEDDEMEAVDTKTDNKADNNEEVDLPIKMSKNWLNMNKVESDKLQWMKNLPKPAAKDSKGAQARFDFNGQLVAKETDVSVREGLHHHGDEQEIPGYSLEELFTLARSSVLNQRVLSLQTLSRILYNSRLQKLGGDLSEPLLPTLLEAGILFLMRWSLDDANEGVITTAVEGLAALLIQPGDENTLDRIYSWYHGHNVPPLVPHILEEAQDENGQPLKDEDISDPQMVQRDVIKVLLRMNTLRRFCFILEKIKPPAPTVLNILSILIRVSRHSSQAAHEICKSPRLLDVIVKEFLPMTGWKQQEGQVTDVYGYPLVYALKLLRVLCATGRNRAASLTAQFKLKSLLLRYLSQEPTDMNLDIASAFYLSMESIRLWHTCVKYGQLTEIYSELYPILVQHLQLFPRLSVLPLPSTTSVGDENVHHLQLQRSDLLILLLEGVMQVAGSAASLLQKKASSKDAPSLPAVEWGHVTGLFDPITLCLRRWLKEMTQCSDTISPSAFSMSASALNFMTSYYDIAMKQPSHSPVDLLSHLEELTNEVIIPFMTSQTFLCLVEAIRHHSAVGKDNQEMLQLIQALPDFGCHHSTQNVIHPVVKKDSSYCFVLALFRLVHSIVCLHRDLAAKFLPVLESGHLVDYIQSISQRGSINYQGVRTFFTRFHLLSLYFLLKAHHCVAKHCKTSRKILTIYHNASLELFVRFQVSDYYYAYQVLSVLLFDPDLLWEGREDDLMAAELSEKLSLTEPVGNQSAHGSSLKRLLSKAYKSIPEIRRLYMLYVIADKKLLENGRAEALHLPYETKSHFLVEATEPVVPQDWMYLPLLQLFTERQKAEMLGKTVKSIPTEIVSGMTNALYWILMMEIWRPTSLDNVELAARIARLYCVFLTSSDLFMEPAVSALLDAILKIYTQPKYLSHLRFDVSIPGLSSFYDLFMELLSQYEAVSFGDQLFANYALLPLQQRFTPRFKLALWVEKTDILHALNLPISKCLIPVKSFLSPPETDLAVLRSYLSSLASASVIQQRAPLMYLIAVHHINQFFFRKDETTTEKNVTEMKLIIGKQLQIANSVPNTKQTWRYHLLLYKSFDPSLPLGFEMYDELPEERAKTLTEVLPT